MNSYILYTLQNPDKRRRLSHEQFRVTLATDLLHAAELVTGSVHYGPRRQSLQPAARLTEWHFPISLGKSPAGWLVQHECSVCSRKNGRKRKTTTYKCQECNLPMCIVPCFELYHTKRDPQKYLEPVCYSSPWCNTEGTTLHSHIHLRINTSSTTSRPWGMCFKLLYHLQPWPCLS